MTSSPSTLSELLASLRVAVEADARAAQARPQGTLAAGVLFVLVALIAQLDALFHAWTPAGESHPAPEWAQLRALPPHLRARALRRARILARGSRGRLRFPTWWARNRGAIAIPSRAPTHPRPISARAPPTP